MDSLMAWQVNLILLIANKTSELFLKSKPIGYYSKPLKLSSKYTDEFIPKNASRVGIFDHYFNEQNYFTFLSS